MFDWFHGGSFLFGVVTGLNIAGCALLAMAFDNHAKSKRRRALGVQSKVNSEDSLNSEA